MVQLSSLMEAASGWEKCLRLFCAQFALAGLVYPAAAWRNRGQGSIHGGFSQRDFRPYALDFAQL
jgi:hypothetical protein